MNYAQLFCTVNDLVADKDSAGSNEARMFQAIRDASDFLQKEIGWFIPVKLTRAFTGTGRNKIFVPPLLQASSIIDSVGTSNPITLSASDYFLLPDNGFWANGPFTEIVLNPLASSIAYFCTLYNGVHIDGLWGKYLRSGTIGASAGSAQDAGDSTLEVSDGGKVSPGMVLIIGDEQEAVTGWDAPTINVTAINMLNGLAISDDVVTVDDASLLNVGEILRAEFEQMKIRDIAGNQCELVRSWNGTRKGAHANDIPIDVYRTVTVERGVNGTDAAAHAQDAAISRYYVPDDIMLQTKEIATLSANKALSGYQGRTGNNETGVVFYNDMFPNFDIEKIKSNYAIPRIG